MLLYYTSQKKLMSLFIVAHKKTKLFLTHCGLLSFQESVYHGVPMLAMPLINDQHANAARIVRMGLGELMPWKELSEQSF